MVWCLLYRLSEVTCCEQTYWVAVNSRSVVTLTTDHYGTMDEATPTFSFCMILTEGPENIFEINLNVGPKTNGRDSLEAIQGARPALWGDTVDIIIARVQPDSPLATPKLMDVDTLFHQRLELFDQETSPLPMWPHHRVYEQHKIPHGDGIDFILLPPSTGMYQIRSFLHLFG